MILGNEEIREQVERLIGNGFFGTLIFSGPQGIGKFLFSQYLTKDVPEIDKRIIDLESEKKDIEQVRELKNFMLLHAYGSIKSVVIRGAESMSLPAQQALLKTLEEPNSKGLVILITSRLSQLLPTTRSRSLTFKFQGIPSEFTEEILKRESFTKEQISEAMKFFPSQPGMAKTLIESNLLANRTRNPYSLDKNTVRHFLLEEMLSIREKSIGEMDKTANGRMQKILQLYRDITDYALNEKIQYANYTIQKAENITKDNVR